MTQSWLISQAVRILHAGSLASISDSIVVKHLMCWRKACTQQNLRDVGMHATPCDTHAHTYLPTKEINVDCYTLAPGLFSCMNGCLLSLQLLALLRMHACMQLSEICRRIAACLLRATQGLQMADLACARVHARYGGTDRQAFNDVAAFACGKIHG